MAFTVNYFKQQALIRKKERDKVKEWSESDQGKGLIEMARKVHDDKIDYVKSYNLPF